MVCTGCGIVLVRAGWAPARPHAFGPLGRGGRRSPTRSPAPKNSRRGVMSVESRKILVLHQCMVRQCCGAVSLARGQFHLGAQRRGSDIPGSTCGACLANPRARARERLAAGGRARSQQLRPRCRSWPAGRHQRPDRRREFKVVQPTRPSVARLARCGLQGRPFGVCYSECACRSKGQSRCAWLRWD
jgi:hypothetical protein